MVGQEDLYWGTTILCPVAPDVYRTVSSPPKEREQRQQPTCGARRCRSVHCSLIAAMFPYSGPANFESGQDMQKCNGSENVIRVGNDAFRDNYKYRNCSA